MTAVPLAAWQSAPGRGASIETFTADAVRTYVRALTITARRTSSGYTSGRARTKGLFAVAPGGYVEATLTVPTAPGLWPGFYLVGADEDANPWPTCGELDVLEVLGGPSPLARTNLHGVDASGGHRTASWDTGAVDLGRSFGDRPTTYGVAFDAERVQFYVNRVPTRRIDAATLGWQWPCDRSFYLALALSVGGKAGDPSGTTFPQKMTATNVTYWEKFTDSPCA